VLDNYYRNWRANKKCAIVHNGVPLQDYLLQKNKGIIRRELGIPENAFVIGHVGRFHESKNHITLIKLFSRIKRQCPSAHLLLVGDGELRPEIEVALEDNVVKTDITMTGIRNDIARLHAAMDVFVYPSIYEGMPTAFVEAMMSGLAFVASNIEEIAEIVPSELQTQLYDPCDENAMCNAVVELYRDTARRDRIGEIGRLWAMDKYTIEKSAKLLCGHILEPFTEQ
jgi:glycosyltransferase involved in cell wall biosynthesis